MQWIYVKKWKKKIYDAKCGSFFFHRLWKNLLKIRCAFDFSSFSIVENLMFFQHSHFFLLKFFKKRREKVPFKFTNMGRFITFILFQFFLHNFFFSTSWFFRFFTFVVQKIFFSQLSHFLSQHFLLILHRKI